MRNLLILPTSDPDTLLAARGVAAIADTVITAVRVFARRVSGTVAILCGAFVDV